MQNTTIAIFLRGANVFIRVCVYMSQFALNEWYNCYRRGEQLEGSMRQ